MFRYAWVMGWLAVGCLVPESLVDRTLDRDGDGHLTLGADGGDDCDDSRASAHPGVRRQPRLGAPRGGGGVRQRGRR